MELVKVTVVYDLDVCTRKEREGYISSMQTITKWQIVTSHAP